MPDTCRGEFLFFLPNQRKWIGKTPCCYNCGTPPTLFWPNPLPSSVNPCEGVLVPMGCPCAGFMPLWNTCEQGDTQALPGFPSPPQLEVLPPPRNHTVSSPSMEVQKICFRTGCWDVTVTRQIVPRFLTTSSCQCLGVYCCVGPVRWYKAPLPQCDCYLAKAELESFYVPVDLDWLQFCHRRLSHCPNFFDGRLLSLALGLLLSKDQVARQCTRHCSQ